jgi:RNA polymerase sigma-70 factor, ECF subfamily
MVDVSKDCGTPRIYYPLSGTFSAREVNHRQADLERTNRDWGRGDEASFTALYRAHQGRLYRFALRMSGSESIAEDVVQEVFLALIRGAHLFDPAQGSMGSFLFGIARNLVRQALRANGDEAPAGEVSSGMEAIADRGTDPLAGLTRGEQVTRVRQAVLSLPPHYREVVVLCDLEEVSYPSAAEALGCAVGTVRSRLHRGRELLLAKLQDVRCPA